MRLNASSCSLYSCGSSVTNRCRMNIALTRASVSFKSLPSSVSRLSILNRRGSHIIRRQSPAFGTSMYCGCTASSNDCSLSAMCSRVSTSLMILSNASCRSAVLWSAPDGRFPDSGSPVPVILFFISPCVY